MATEQEQQSHPLRPRHFGEVIYYFLATSGGLGFFPVAPGTVGTFGGVALFAAIIYTGTYSFWLLSVLVVLLTFIGGLLGPWMEEAWGESDPSSVVIDEVAGYLIAVAVFDLSQPVVVGVAAFIAFRFFDILKPWPIPYLERIPQGWGVMIDDLMAGVYAAVAVNLFLWIW